jgi:hypothetical protein
MTEEQAKEKWCPMVHSYSGSPAGGGFFTSGGDNRYARCIGSACMMWRWRMVLPHGMMNGKVHESATDGYCGLAGKP